MRSGGCFSEYSRMRSTGSPSRSTVSTFETPFSETLVFASASIRRAPSIVSTTDAPGGISIPYAAAMTGMTHARVSFALLRAATSVAWSRAAMDDWVPSYATRIDANATRDVQ